MAGVSPGKHSPVPLAPRLAWNSAMRCIIAQHVAKKSQFDSSRQYAGLELLSHRRSDWLNPRWHNFAGSSRDFRTLMLNRTPQVPEQGLAEVTQDFEKGNDPKPADLNDVVRNEAISQQDINCEEPRPQVLSLEALNLMGPQAPTTRSPTIQRRYESLRSCVSLSSLCTEESFELSDEHELSDDRSPQRVVGVFDPSLLPAQPRHPDINSDSDSDAELLRSFSIV